MKYLIGNLAPGTKIIMTENLLDSDGMFTRIGRYMVGKSTQFKSGKPCIEVLTSAGNKRYTLVNPNTEVIV